MSNLSGHFIPIEKCSDAALYGGKAVGLYRLVRIPIPVPSAFCLSTARYREVVQDARCASAACAAIESWQPNVHDIDEFEVVRKTLGWPLALRSSATCEDAISTSHAGVFASEVNVCDNETAFSAIRRIWASLWCSVARTTLRRQGSNPEDEAMAVIVQRYVVHAKCSGFALSRVQPRKDDIVIEATDGGLAGLASGEVIPQRLEVSRRDEVSTVADFPLSTSLLEELRTFVLKVERDRGERVEVEWIVEAGRDLAGKLWFVQARPYPDAPAAASGERAPARDDRTIWRFDAEHNPDPLSPVHQSLIEYLEATGPAARTMKLFQGYLYYADIRRPIDSDYPVGTIRQTLSELEFGLERAEHALTCPNEMKELAAALVSFSQFYRRYQRELAPQRSHALNRLREALAAYGVGRDEDGIVQAFSLGLPHGSSRHTLRLLQIADCARAATPEGRVLASWILADESDERLHLRRPDLPLLIARYLDDYGLLASRWDLAEPTFHERPQRLRLLLRRLFRKTSTRQTTASEMISADSVESSTEHCREILASEAVFRRYPMLSSLPRAPHFSAFVEIVRGAREARASAEDDDLLFGRALWIVRKALLDCAKRWVRQGLLSDEEQIFCLRIDAILEASGGEAVGSSLQYEALEGWRGWQAQRRIIPPLTIQGRSQVFQKVPRGETIEGIGVGGRVRAEVIVVENLAALLEEPQSVLGTENKFIAVCPTLTPALAPILGLLAGLITDYGGRLSHAACLAAEIGLPAVVGTQCATRVLKSGDPVWLDGDEGQVVRIETVPMEDTRS